MGVVYSKWKKKPSRTEILESLNKKIEKMEQNKQVNLERKKRIVTMWLIYSVLIYLVAAIVIFLYFLPSEMLWKVIYSLPFLIFPLIIYSIKRFLHWYYVKNIERNEKELGKLKTHKMNMLNEIKATETYNVAQELLLRFDGENSILDSSIIQSSDSPLRYRGKNVKSSQENKSSLKKPHKSPEKQPQTPHQQAKTPHQHQNSPQKHPNSPQQHKPPFNLPQPSKYMQQRDRTYIDRLVDYLLTDGPSNRYALICSNCHGHNGLAIKEDFEYLTYRCCYCSHLNKAPKQKPTAPALKQSPPKPQSLSSATNMGEYHQENVNGRGFLNNKNQVSVVPTTGQPSHRATLAPLGTSDKHSKHD